MACQDVIIPSDLLHSNRTNICMPVAAASCEHVRSCDFYKIAECLAYNVDDGVVSEKVLAKRACEANWSVVQDTETSNARHEHVGVFVLCCRVVSHISLRLIRYTYCCHALARHCTKGTC